MKMTTSFSLLLFLGCYLMVRSSAFLPRLIPPVSIATTARTITTRITPTTSTSTSPTTTATTTPTTTCLKGAHYDYRLLELPRYFFTITMVGGAIILNIGKYYARIRMAERAWEQRVEEGRKRRLELDPTLIELDLRRREAALEWSAYGKPRMQEEAAAAQRQQQEQEQEQGRRRRRVKVMERNDDAADLKREYAMTNKEIEIFEREFGIDYDPYYDDPYTLEELPQGKCKVDKVYGDRIYDNGEIFYLDADTGLFFLQGSKPRSIKLSGL